MKKFLKILLIILLSIVASFVLLLGYRWITEWSPKSVEVCYEASELGRVDLPDTLTIISWNIGYAGLGDDMDFFYDGGKSVRTSKERTMQNLDSIIAFLQCHNNADFILLQEIDFDSKRSYNVNQFDAISGALQGYNGVFAYNYVSQFVPIPVLEPIGGVCSGMATFSKFPIAKALRYQYPSGFAFPVRLFNLKRALLSTSVLMQNGDTLFVNNTHNTAYDTGDMRVKEIDFLSNYLSSRPGSITVGDWNCNPPGYVAGAAELENEYFSPIAVSESDFASDMTFAADLSRASVRYGYEPYRAGVTTTTLLDFALIGSALRVVDVEIVDLQFRNSDHNPVILRVAR